MYLSMPIEHSLWHTRIGIFNLNRTYIKQKQKQGGLNKKEIQLNLSKILSIFIFNELYLFG